MLNKFLWLALTFGLLLPTSGNAQTPSSATTNSAPATNAPPTNAPAAIPLANVISEADTTSSQLRDIDNTLNTDPSITAVDEEMPGLTRSIDFRQGEDAKLLQSISSLAALRTAQAAWQTLAKNFSTSQRALIDRITVLDGQIKQLNDLTQKWQATLVLAKTSSAPSETIQKINNTLSSLRSNCSPDFQYTPWNLNFDANFGSGFPKTDNLNRIPLKL